MTEMIVANIATYPPRLGSLNRTIGCLLPQVDRINIVFNEFSAVPSEFVGSEKINAIIPVDDTKDTGKFLPESQNADWIILCDDDILYPKTYVQDSIRELSAVSEPNAIGGYHGSIYRRARLKSWSVGGLRRYMKERRRPVGELRDVIKIDRACVEPVVVDQLGTGVMILKPQQMPPFEYMRTSQKFVDVRMAKWCFESGILQVCLPHPDNYMQGVEHDETIYRDFTKSHHRHVLDEIAVFAFRNERSGQVAKTVGKG